MPIISAIGIYNRRPDILRLRRIGLRSSGRIRPTISVANKRVEAAGWRAWMPPLYHQHLRGVPMAKPQNNPAQRRFNRHRRSMTGFSPDFGASCRVSHSTISRLLASGWGIKLEGRYPALTIGSGGNVDADGCAKNSATERKERVDAPPTGWKLVRPLWPSADCRGMPMAASRITLHRLTNQRSEWTHLSCRIACVHSGHRGNVGGECLWDLE